MSVSGLGRVETVWRSGEVEEPTDALGRIVPPFHPGFVADRSRRMTSEVRQPTRPLRRKGSLHFQPLCSLATVPKNFHSFSTGHRPPRSRSTDRPMNKFQPRSSAAQFQPKFLSKNSQRNVRAYAIIHCLRELARTKQ